MIERDAQVQLETVRAGLCPDCGASLPPPGVHCGMVECACGAAWSIEHLIEPPREGKQE